MSEILIPTGLFVVCIACAVLAACLAYFLYNMVVVIKDLMKNKVNPMLDDVKSLLEKIVPLMDKANPMMDRITLTIDAANLEIMRVDQVLEDVNVITGNLAQASESIDTAASTPVDMVGNVSRKIRDKVSGKKGAAGTKGVIFSAVDEGLVAVGDRVAAYQARTGERKVELEAKAEERATKLAEAVQTSDYLKKAVAAQIEEDCK